MLNDKACVIIAFVVHMHILLSMTTCLKIIQIVYFPQNSLTYFLNSTTMTRCHKLNFCSLVDHSFN